MRSWKAVGQKETKNKFEISITQLVPPNYCCYYTVNVRKKGGFCGSGSRFVFKGLQMPKHTPVTVFGGDYKTQTEKCEIAA